MQEATLLPLHSDVPILGMCTRSARALLTHLWNGLQSDDVTKMAQHIGELVFQALSWSGEDRHDDDGVLKYVMDVYGRTADGHSVCAHVEFTPYFFVELPPLAQKHDIDSLKEALRRRLNPDPRSAAGSEEPPQAPQLKIADVVTRIPIYGFRNREPTRFLRIVVLSKKAKLDAERVVRGARYCGNRSYELYESNVPCELRLLHVRNIESAGWIKVTKHLYHVEQRPTWSSALLKETTCSIEVSCSYKSLQPAPERTGLAPIVVASFDLECMSPDGSFPDPLKVDCPVIQIATTFWRYGDKEPYLKHIVCLSDTDPLPNVEVVTKEKEAEVLAEWAQVLRREDVDVLLGYNIWGFDLNFMHKRATDALGGPHHGGDELRKFLYGLGKRKNTESRLIRHTLETSAYGHNEFLVPTTPGMLQIDLLPVIKKEHKLVSYKLEAVATHFLNEHKVDLPIKEMFALYRGNSADRAKIAEYCVQDTVLPLRLLRHLVILENMVEMAKATHVPIDWLIFKGQQIKVFSLITKKARELGYLCPSKPKDVKEEGGKYQGATVLEAKVGAHWNVITCLDFASLYPSIMRAHTMCHSTVVLDEARYGNLPGIEYTLVQVEEGKPPVKFAQVPTEKTVMPALLADLAMYRKKARKEQKAALDRGDSALSAVYIGQQLAYKVSMNSFYGFCGASNGYMPCLPIAASITTVGRDMILHTKNLVEETYASRGTQVVYGDSVAGHTPIVIRSDGCMFVVAIEDVVQSTGLQWQRCWEYGRVGKEVCNLEGMHLQTWTEEGWTDLHRIIRHKLAPHKRGSSG